jgi:hypothetical protein
MKKLFIFMMIAALMGCIAVSAQNPSASTEIALYETKTVTVPSPEGEIDEGFVYFQQEFLFTPEESGTYRLLIRYEEDETNPYPIHLDLPGEYRELDNGIEFEATAGETYPLCFQYLDNDGRNPQFRFYLCTPETAEIPKTGDLHILMPLLCLVVSLTFLITVKQQKHTF